MIPIFDESDEILTKEEIEYLTKIISEDNYSQYNNKEISDFSKLEDIDIAVIEKYLRMKKLEALNKKNKK